VVRGGSFGNNNQNVRCAVRNRNNPHERNNNLGVRVVVLPTFFSLLPRQKCQAAYASWPRRKKNGGAYSWPRRFVRPGK
jgi:hypothetical protein